MRVWYDAFMKSKKKRFSKHKILALLSDVIDPDLGNDIVSLGFVDEVRKDYKGRVVVKFHLLSPFELHGLETALLIRKLLLDAGYEPKVLITDHKDADRINFLVNRPDK